MKITHIFLISLVLTITLYVFLRQSLDLSLALIALSGLLGGIICFLLFMIRERKVLAEKRDKIPLENFFGLAVISLFVGFTVLTIPLLVELVLHVT